MRDLGRRDRLDEAARQRNVALRVLELDVTAAGSIERAVRTIAEECGGLYGVIGNAGIQVRGYFEDLADREVRQAFETNVFGTMAVVRAALPHMRARCRGRIVVVTSVGGKIGSPGLSAYCASKFALEGFAEALGLEVGPLGIQVILVEPGIVGTEIWGPNRGIAARALDPAGPYYAWFRESERLADRLVEASCTTPADVARTVHRALTAARPRRRYVVGGKAATIVALRRYLPGELFERVYFAEVVRRVTRAGRISARWPPSPRAGG
jgi:NAD(P)-dependent dehydrogenase (short-subunit alcohol dehydrogenase family)